MLFGCGGRGKEPAPLQAPAVTPAVPAAPVAAPPPGTGSPPVVAYTPPQPWRSRKDPPEIVAPPDPAKEVWRAFVNQHEPIQIKTPLWRPLPAAETIALEMPANTPFRCIVTPLQVEPESNDFSTKLIAWILRRDLLCSADGWRSWTEHPHSVRVLADGTRQTTTMAQVRLRERDAKPPVRQTFVLVRDDPERRAATTGPPRVLLGVPVDDD